MGTKSGQQKLERNTDLNPPFAHVAGPRSLLRLTKRYLTPLFVSAVTHPPDPRSEFDLVTAVVDGLKDADLLINSLI